ncbi:hypothetical protein [Cystobacter fuscus]|uniref:hypothetical protein n=1 Tax=Cystobacter fuscus TaxID=43 RepID=UPI0005BB5693|nr:hypothetical protein [Cystobacter fuscus]
MLTSACRSEPEPAPGEASLVRAFGQGTLAHRATPREGYAGLKLRASGERTYVLEITRRPDSTESRRFVAYGESEQVLWRLDEQPQERFTDFTVHPSGDVSLGVERTADARETYDLVRLSAEGTVRVRQPVPRAETLPASDLVGLPTAPFLMRSEPTAGLVDKWLPWLRLEARGEDVVLAFLTFVDVPDGDFGYQKLVSGVMAARWSGEHYGEEWTRVVDSEHALLQVSWEYDEFHWRDAATQPLLAVSPEGRVVVGRGLGAGRCGALARVFQEISSQECSRLKRGTPHRYVPFAYTAFSPTGAREGTRVLAPEEMEEFLVFDMALRGGELALGGTASVRPRDDENLPYYPPAPGEPALMVPYDGYVAVVDVATGALRSTRALDVSEGRGDHVAALRWTEEGLLAVGATGWDRWNSGMSVSRAAEPFLALIPEDGGQVLSRRLSTGSPDRHFHLLGVEVRGDTVLAVGLADAPMTHSGDGGRTDLMTFGGLRVDLR